MDKYGWHNGHFISYWDKVAFLLKVIKTILGGFLKMGQVKVYGLKENLNSIKSKMSDVIHSCVVEAFQFPKDKRFQ